MPVPCPDCGSKETALHARRMDCNACGLIVRSAT